MFALSRFCKILVRNPQHTKTLAMLLAQVLVVHLVRPANGAKIDIVGLTQPLKALMNEDVVYNEVGETIHGDAKAYKQ